MKVCRLLKKDDLYQVARHEWLDSLVRWEIPVFDLNLAPRIPLLDEEAAVSRLTSDVSRWGGL